MADRTPSPDIIAVTVPGPATHYAVGSPGRLRRQGAFRIIDLGDTDTASGEDTEVIVPAPVRAPPPPPRRRGGAPTRNTQCKAWIGTWNVGTTEDDADRVMEFVRHTRVHGLENVQRAFSDGLPRTVKVTHFAAQAERGAGVNGQPGRYHIQFFVRWEKRLRFSQVKDAVAHLFGDNTAHIEAARDPADAFDYCQKEDTRLPNTEPVVFGDRDSISTQGKRSDVDRVHERIWKDKDSLFEICKSEPATLRLQRGLQLQIGLRDDETDVLTDPPFVVVLHGPSGTGKSAFVHRHWPVHYKADTRNDKWWDGLPPQAVVVIDDYGGKYDYQFLMNLMDRYPVRFEVKGAIMMRRPVGIVITSIRHPRDWYVDQPYEDGLQRRVEDGIFASCISTWDWPKRPRGCRDWDPEAQCPMTWDSTQNLVVAKGDPELPLRALEEILYDSDIGADSDAN